MGGGRWSDSDWGSYASKHVTGKSTHEIYTSHKMDKLLDPKGVTLRESRDSELNPESNAIILAQDVTGSMSPVLHSIIEKGLHTLITEIYERKPVTDPHVMIMGIGDVECDSAPFQVTQFEADIRLAEQLTKLYLEQGGGGNNYESYTLAWYFAALKTSIDCFEKRGKKGYLFTIGDEEPTRILRSASIEQFLGEKPQTDFSPEDLLAMVSRMYEVYHVMIEEGNHYSTYGKEVTNAWTKLLGQRAIHCSDHTKLAEIIVSAIQVHEGTDKAAVVSSWKDSKTAAVVKRAIDSLDKKGASTGSVVRF